MSEWVTIPEALRILGVGRTTLYRWLNDGRLRYYVPPGGGRRRLKRADLEAFMQLGAPKDEPEPGSDPSPGAPGGEFREQPRKAEGG